MIKQTSKPSRKRYFGMLGLGAALLSLPFLAMQFTKEVNWSAFDFLLMGILLFALISGIEWTLRNLNSTSKRFVVVGLILLSFLLIWAELAVGIFHSPIAGN